MVDKAIAQLTQFRGIPVDQNVLVASAARRVAMATRDQLNADDLIGGPRTITVTRVSKMKEPDQPIAIYFEGDGGKPYKPGKSMRRVLLRTKVGTTQVVLILTTSSAARCSLMQRAHALVLSA